ncbi:hypothetical protein DQ240_07580 [Blastococcus sp. TF02A-26]|nr:hypothetical protein DQ240_07580 [Blastococcus sp. TF02A-26]
MSRALSADFLRVGGQCISDLHDPATDEATGEVCGEEGRLCEACLAAESAWQLDEVGGFARFDRELAERRATGDSQDEGLLAAC